MSVAPELEPQTQRQARKRVLERFAILFERQVRMYQYVDSIGDLVRAMHLEVFGYLQESMRKIQIFHLLEEERAEINRMLGEMALRFSRLDKTLALLLRERSKQRHADDTDLKHVLLETNRSSQQLEATLIEKNLFERHTQMLETIVLSREKIMQWKDYVSEILAGFQRVLAFDYFFTALVDEDTLLLTIYFFAHCHERVRAEARANLAMSALTEMGLPRDMRWQIDEYVIPSDARHDESELRMVTAPVPALDASNNAGLLGVACRCDGRAHAQEMSVVRSIMAVMVMVVGSSKTLSRTLSDLEYFSAHDPLTGLHNRRAFNEILSDEIGRSERHRHEMSLLMIDLDDFKDINDSYGHPCGDTVLQIVADILRSILRKGDFATRIGGDEFAVLLTETSSDGAHAVAEKLRHQIRERVFEDAGGKIFHVTASIGIVSYPENASSISDLMAGVDIGLYRAKEMGKDGVVAAGSVKEMLLLNRNARDFVEQLRASLKDGRIVPYYQPIFDCRSGDLFAHEALARMRQASGETLPAGMFIEAIEKYGLGRDLGRAMIEQVLQKMLVLRDRKKTALPVFINLSAQEIQNRGILSFAEKLCGDLSVNPSSIVFEILERDAIGDMAHMRSFLAELREKGFLFALDDFGSGYNSFHYLRELTFDYVKIDGAFVKTILNSSVDYALVKNMTRLCQDIGIKTVAEFVESESILLALRDIGVDFVQGYHLGRPAPEMCAPLFNSIEASCRS